MNEKDSILIFDTNIFLMGVDFNLIEGIIYTTHNIIEEVKVERYIDKNRNIINRIQAAIDSGKLKVRTPLKNNVSEINKSSKMTGDYNALSTPDKELIALALELKSSQKKIIVYTNDYSMQNLCSEMGITFAPLIRKGIKSKILWEVYCPHCEDIHKVEELNEQCEICGSKLKRRPKK